MQKRINHLLKNDLFLNFLICIISIFAIYSLFKSDFFSTHDGVTHVARFAQFHQALIDGQFPPRWASNVAYGLGSPVLMFNAPLPYFVSEVPYFIVNNYHFAIEIIFALSWIASGIAFYYFAKDLFGKVPGFLGGLFYIYAPYRFIDVYVRGAFPESFSFIFPPLILLFAKRLIENPQKRYLIELVLSMAGVILSHNVIALLSSGLLFLYSLVLILLYKKVKRIILIFIAYILALLLSAFYWIPAIFEKHFANLDNLINPSSYVPNFAPIEWIIYSPWAWGPLRSESPMSPQLGLTQILALIISVMLISMFFLRNKLPKKIKSAMYFEVNKIQLIHYFIFLFLLIISVFLMTKYSRFFWDNITLLAFFLYPWRFLTLAIFCVAIIASFNLSVLKNNKIILIIFVILLLYSNRNHSQLVGVVQKNEDFYKFHTDTTDMWGEFMSKSVSLEFVEECKKKRCQNYDELSTPKDVKYSLLTHRSNLIQVKYNSEEDSNLTLNNSYFPGWKYYIDDLEIKDYKLDRKGVPLFEIPSGEHILTARFENTPIRNLAIVVSGFSLIGIVGFSIWPKRFY